MARLPDLGTERQSAPSPAMGMVEVDNQAVSKAIIGLGHTVSEIGQMVSHEQERRNLSAAEDAFTKARQEQIDLASGPEGYLNQRGESALKPDFHKQYLDKFDGKVQKITNGLQNTEQQDLFKKRAAISRMQVSEGLLNHTMQQDEVVSKQRYLGTLSVEQKAAQMNALNPSELGLSLVRVRESVKAQAERNDWPPELAKAEEEKQVSAIHETVIDTMIQQGYDLNAQQYYDGVKKTLSVDATERIDKKVKSATTDGKAVRSVDKVWSEVGPMNINDPVKVFSMESKIREILNDDPTTQKAAIAELRIRVAGFNAQQSEVRASNVSYVMDKYNKGTSLANLKKLPEFSELPGEEQTRIIEHITDRGYTMEQRARVDKERADNPDAQSIYWGIRDSTQIDSLSDNEILALQPHIGTHLVDSLMQERARPDRVTAIALDNQVVKDVYSEITGKVDIKSKPDQAALARLSIASKERIDHQQRISGKRLTYEETKKIVQEVADQKVMKETWWGLGSEQVPLISVGSESRKKVITPIEQIPQDQMSGMINLMRSRGVVKNWVTDDVAKEKYKNNLQKAYGRFQAGGTQQEVIDALDGR